MNLYAHDFSLLDLGDFSDPISTSHHLHRPFSSSIFHGDDDGRYREDDVFIPKPKSPPRHRHDGTSPLPLGMDWSLPPRIWDGRNTIWPHDPSTGWSYCVAIPSWIILPNSRGSDTVVFYRVQVGIQSPEGITTSRGILRRFSDFLKLLSDVSGIARSLSPLKLKRAFPQKEMPPAPPRRILGMKNRASLEERRCSLDVWMEKLLSDIDVSRSALVGTFLELEAAARAYFDEYANSSVSDMVPSVLFQTNSEVSVLAGSSSIASDHGNDSPEETSELGSPSHGRNNIVSNLGMEASTSGRNISDPIETTVKYGTFNKNFLDNLERFAWRKKHPTRERANINLDKLAENMSEAKSFLGDETESFSELEYQRLDGHVRRLSTESIGSDLSSVRASDVSNLGTGNLFGDDSLDFPEGSETPRTNDATLTSNIQIPKNLVVAFPSDARYKLNRVLNTVRQRLATTKTDMEDLIARLNQEVAVRQFLTTKVKDLEVDLEITKNNCKENMQQAVLMERERFTQMQWDVEELRKECLELELKLKSEQDAKTLAESAKGSMMEENELLLQQLDITREELDKVHKNYEELELKSKADLKLLVKEVKSLRSSQSELKQDLSRVMKEKLEVERFLQKEKQRVEHVTTANAKLLHECEILRNRLQECSVNFLIEEEDKLIVDTSSPSDAIDLLTTSDNRIGLLLAEAQLLAQDIENSTTRLDEAQNANGSERTDDALRKMLTEIFIDNARLRMQVNSVIRCALNPYAKSDKEEEEGEEETSSRKTVLSKFLER